MADTGWTPPMDDPAMAASQAAAQPATAPRRRGLRSRIPILRGRGNRGGDGGEPEVMPLVDHLRELRNRVVISVLALIPGTVLGFIYYEQIVKVLTRPLPLKPGQTLYVFGLTDAFMLNLKVALAVGIILAMPVLLYELWAFVSPGLTPSERRAARPWIPLALVFFCIGVGVAYFILPVASGFLFGFQTPQITLLLAADRYLDFVTTLFLAFGAIMEFPILLVFLSKIHVVSSERLAGARRMALLGITIVATFITPGADLISPLVMLVTMYVLYELSIILIRWSGN